MDRYIPGRSSARWRITSAAAKNPMLSSSPPPRVGPEGSDADIEAKAEANIRNLSPGITQAFPKIVDAWGAARAPKPVITSGNDSDHKRGSLHYAEEAIDLRCNNISDAHCERITGALRKSLGPDYDVIFEKYPKEPARDHIHIEHQPASQPKRQAVSALQDNMSIGDWMRVRNGSAFLG